MSAITAFYSNKGHDHQGRTITDLLTHKREWYEGCHDWVQWLFPSREPSNYCAEAPLLNQNDVEFLKERKDKGVSSNINIAVCVFLDFLGLQCSFNKGDLNTIEVTSNKALKKRHAIWMDALNHNHLRITRFLAFLSIIGYREAAVRILNTMIILSGVRMGHDKKFRGINPDSLGYWKYKGLGSV